MAQNMLKELLKEDQEPFHLIDYITNKQHQLKKQTQIQLINKPKHLTKYHPSFICKNSCFFSLQNSPNINKSPLFEFTKSPCKSPNRMFLNVPSKTASLLLEAAMRIHKQTKPDKYQAKNSGLGLFGSVLKRLTSRKRSSKTEENRGKQSKMDPNNGVVVELTNVGSSTTTTTTCSSLSLSYLDEISCSSSGRSINGCCDDDDEFVFSNVLKDNDNGGGDYGLCLSPLSPFRFALRSSPSPELRSPELCSPVKSSLRDDDVQDNVKYEEEGSLVKFHVQEEDEEDKEQNSPVSVLDPPFEDDYDVHEEEEEGYELECSYAFVQRAKQHLLHKLQRFEKLAELDPIELQKRLIEDEVDYEEYDYESFSFNDENQVDIFIDEIIAKSGFQDIRKPGIKRLISDIIIEEEIELDNEEQVTKRVCKRLESWKDVEANTIDMMVGMDLRREIGDWKNYKEQIDEIAKDFEVAFFAILVDELVNDLIS